MENGTRNSFHFSLENGKMNLNGVFISPAFDTETEARQAGERMLAYLLKYGLSPRGIEDSWSVDTWMKTGRRNHMTHTATGRTKWGHYDPFYRRGKMRRVPPLAAKVGDFGPNY